MKSNSISILDIVLGLDLQDIEKYRKLISTQSQIPSLLTPRKDVFVFYANCKNSTAFGDFTLAGSVAYHIGKETNLPIILTTSKKSVNRFDTLYRCNRTGKHRIYDLPVQVFTIEQFDSLNVNIVAYFESGCKHNYKEYVKQVMLRDGGKFAMLRAPKVTKDFSYSEHQFPELYENNRAKDFFTGFGEDRAGVGFSKYATFSKSMSECDLKFSHLPEAFISANPNYGLIYISANEPIVDTPYLAGYLIQVLTKNESKLVIAIGDEDIVNEAIERIYSKAIFKNKPITHLHFDENETRFYRKDSESPVYPSVSPIHPNSLPGLTIISCRRVSNLQLRRLIANSAPLVGFTGTSSAIEAFGEGKIVYYQYDSSNDKFAVDYIKALKTIINEDPELFTFAALLIAPKILDFDNEANLISYLAKPHLCKALQKANKKIVKNATKQLSNNLLGWLKNNETVSPNFGTEEMNKIHLDL